MQSWQAKKVDLLISQPVLTTYRMPFFLKLAERYNTVILASLAKGTDGFSLNVPQELHVEYDKTFAIDKHFFYQCGIISGLLKYHPRKIFITANPRNISFWFAIILCKLLHIKTYAHGHGIYNKKNPGAPLILIYRCMVSLSTYYICYTESCRKAMVNIGCNDKKLRVVDNTLHNEFSIPSHKKDFSKSNILFVGRLREGCNLELLFKIFPAFLDAFPDSILHIVGGGEKEDGYRHQAARLKNIVFHGQLYNDKEISVIAQDCLVGIYPGNAGLSVVHYMSLSLPPIVHNDLYAHGPEVSYIQNEVNGFTFKRDDANELLQVLLKVFSNKEAASNAAKQAYSTYENLSKPDMADKLISVFNE